MRKNKKYITLVLLLLSIQMYSQAVPPPIPPPPPPGLPIDSGVMYLLLGGILFGIKKLKEKQ